MSVVINKPLHKYQLNLNYLKSTNSQPLVKSKRAAFLKRKTKNRFIRFAIVVCAVLMLSLIISAIINSPMNNKVSGDSETNDTLSILSQNIDEMLDNLDITGIEQVLNSLNDQQRALFGGDIKTRLKALVNGETVTDYETIFGYLASALGISVTAGIPLMLSVLVIVMAYNVINTLKARSSGESIERIIYFAVVGLVLVMLLTTFYNVLSGAISVVTAISTQIEIFLPILLTLMAATGAVSSSAVYSPSVAFLGGGLTALIVSVAIPMIIMALIFTVIDSLSDSVKLKGIADFFYSAVKWLLGTAFFVFFAVVSVQGITASVRDGISIRAAKFAVSKYVPIIGGYLSEGFNLIMAGSVLIKNAIGVSALVIILIAVVPTIVNLAVLSLSLKLTGALCEPLGGEKFTRVIGGFSKSISMLAVVLIGLLFLYLLFLTMILCTGNLAL